MKTLPRFAAALAALAGITAFSARAGDGNAALTAALAELAEYQARETIVANRLETFDVLDFEVFSSQQWGRLHESHAGDVIVHWPDGRTTTGIDVHIEDLKAFFVYAPDTRIESHPVRIGQGEWTGVVGVIEGTFTGPMPLGDGKFLEPTGRSFKLTMATIGHWNDEGVMDEEHLFWDNLAFMKQIGLAE